MVAEGNFPFSNKEEGKKEKKHVQILSRECDLTTLLYLRLLRVIPLFMRSLPFLFYIRVGLLIRTGYEPWNCDCNCDVFVSVWQYCYGARASPVAALFTLSIPITA